jgi:hypothetical protein
MVTVVPERTHLWPMTVVVDIANVMGARADGWWKDRARAAARLCREVGDLSGRGLTAAELPAEVAGVLEGGIEGDRVYPVWVLVLEGAARKAVEPLALVDPDGKELVLPMNLEDLGPWARLVLAPGSGDDAIAKEAADLQGCRIVVTADRELRRRCEQAGAFIAGPRWLLGLL